ncbi:MAG: hypothetical protein KGI38_07380, partial [Thaumarchaeota archaeon]|nr:hypothetical protein [Nitrososphaerota archaeon]
YRELGVSVVTAAAVVAPFLAWNFSAFFQDTVLFQFQRQAVSFFSAGPFGLNVNPSLEGILLAFGASVPLWARGSLAALALVLILWKSGRDLPGLALASAASSSVLLFFLSGDIFWSYFELPFMMLLVWLAFKSQERAPSTLKEKIGGSAHSG